MATSLISLQSALSKEKCKSLVSRHKSSLNSDLLKLSMVSDFLKSSFVQISIVFPKGMLVVKNGATWGKLEPTTKIQKNNKIQKKLNLECCLSFESASG